MSRGNLEKCEKIQEKRSGSLPKCQKNLQKNIKRQISCASCSSESLWKATLCRNPPQYGQKRTGTRLRVTATAFKKMIMGAIIKT
jgi:hypothetical protein